MQQQNANNTRHPLTASGMLLSVNRFTRDRIDKSEIPGMLQLRHFNLEFATYKAVKLYLWHARVCCKRQESAVRLAQHSSSYYVANSEG